MLKLNSFADLSVKVKHAFVYEWELIPEFKYISC